MTIEKQLNGSYLIYTTDNKDQFIKQVYYGYTKKEAKDLFLKHLADLLVKEIIQSN